MIWEFEKFHSKVAVIDDCHNTLTYAELAKESKNVGEKIGKRCLVFVLCKNTLGSLIGYVGCMQNNIVPVLLNAQTEIASLFNLIHIYQPAFLWVPIEQQIFENTEEVCRIHDYKLLKTPYHPDILLYKDLALLLTTSGSTGSPKFVRQSYTNIKANAEAITTYLKLTQDERPITTLPMYYTYGLSVINSHFLVGATLLLTEKTLMQKEFWDFLKKEKATSLAGVPYTYEILDKLRFLKMDLPSLRYLTQAGGKLTFDLHKKFADYAIRQGKKFIVMYGQCEATARMGYLPSDKASEKCGAMGIAIPGGRFYLCDENGKEINTPGITGELMYEGQNVTLGYAQDLKDLCKGDERHGILPTGDMAQFDQEGYYYIVGRKKRFLKIYGNRVNLDEIERLIKEEFSTIECAGTGTDDHLYLFVTDESLAKPVKKFITSKTQLNPAAFKVIVVHEIPKNDAGKILYGELECYYK